MEKRKEDKVKAGGVVKDPKDEITIVSPINERKKRSTECSDEDSINSECDATNSVTNIDPENPLELIFNPAKSGDREELMKEAKKEYQDNFSGMDIKSSYDALFEILWYTQVPCCYRSHY